MKQQTAHVHHCLNTCYVQRWAVPRYVTGIAFITNNGNALEYMKCNDVTVTLHFPKSNGNLRYSILVTLKFPKLQSVKY